MRARSLRSDMRRASPPFFTPSRICMYTRRSPSWPGRDSTSITWHFMTTLDPGMVMAPPSTSMSMPANLSSESEWPSPSLAATAA